MQCSKVDLWGCLMMGALINQQINMTLLGGEGKKEEESG